MKDEDLGNERRKWSIIPKLEPQIFFRFSNTINGTRATDKKSDTNYTNLHEFYFVSIRVIRVRK